MRGWGPAPEHWTEGGLASCSALGATVGGPGYLEGPGAWECGEGASSAAPSQTRQSREAACLSARMLAVLTTSSLSSQGLRFLRSWALPAQGYPDSRKALRKGGGKVDHSALSRSVQQGCGIMRSYIYKMHLFRVLVP